MNKPRYKFSVAICPLCDKELKVLNGLFGPNVMIWQCETIESPPNAMPCTHYQVEWDKTTGVIVQHMVVGQFYLDTYNTDWLTRISVPIRYLGYGSNGKIIMTVPQIHPDKPEKLLERVRTLVIFS